MGIHHSKANFGDQEGRNTLDNKGKSDKDGVTKREDIKDRKDETGKNSDQEDNAKRVKNLMNDVAIMAARKSKVAKTVARKTTMKKEGTILLTMIHQGLHQRYKQMIMEQRRLPEGQYYRHLKINVAITTTKRKATSKTKRGNIGMV